MSGMGLPSEVQPRPREGPLSGAKRMDQRPYPVGVFPQMSLKPEDIIYTRKSSEEGLEQDFNSLDAQRESCEAFILSQKHEGWTALPRKVSRSQVIVRLANGRPGIRSWNLINRMIEN